LNHHSLRRANILVMHPDPIVCAGLVAALGTHAAFQVLVHGVDAVGPDGPMVDAVIADYGNAMRLTDGAVRRTHGLRDDTRILALTSSDREAEVRRAIEAGVYGYLLVGSPLHELIDAVNAVASGLRYMSRSVAQRMAESLTRAALTSREIEVLRLVAMGQPNKAIARQLGIELATVKSHMSAIMAKLDAGSRTEAARIAATRGLIEDFGHPGVDRLGPPGRKPVAELQYV
jgi:DNA-binding NarL/FixJ family response regulator